MCFCNEHIKYTLQALCREEMDVTDMANSDMTALRARDETVVCTHGIRPAADVHPTLAAMLVADTAQEHLSTAAALPPELVSNTFQHLLTVRVAPTIN